MAPWLLKTKKAINSLFSSMVVGDGCFMVTGSSVTCWIVWLRCLKGCGWWVFCWLLLCLFIVIVLDGSSSHVAMAISFITDGSSGHLGRLCFVYSEIARVLSRRYLVELRFRGAACFHGWVGFCFLSWTLLPLGFRIELWTELCILVCVVVTWVVAN